MRPLIAETGYEFVKDPRFNTLNIYLDARPTSDLAWESVESEIATALKLGAKLSFEIDLGFSESKALLRDPAAFFSRGIAISTFEERVYQKYKEHITAIILYRGTGSFKGTIAQDASLYADFMMWKRELFKEESVSDHMMRLFSMELFMQVLHRIAAPLIDEIPLVALFDLADSSRASYQAEILSASYFPYILPGVKHSKIHFKGFGWGQPGNLGTIGHKYSPLIQKEPTNLGIVLPPIGSVPYDLFDEVIQELVKNKIDYSIFPETLMTENWHGLDHILVFSESVSSEGRRMLQGFNAAAGQVITVGESLNLAEEINSKEFIRSRGI